MGLRNSSYAYGSLARAFHWLTVLAVTLAWMIGLFHEALPKGSPERAAAMLTHFSLGLSIVALLIMRVVWRVADPAPRPEPTPLGRLGEISAAAIHGVAYLLLLAVPVVGVMMVFAAGHALPVFGLAMIPPPIAADPALAKMLHPWHEWLAHALMAVAFVHALAALMHHWVFHDRTLTRMLGRA